MVFKKIEKEQYNSHIHPLQHSTKINGEEEIPRRNSVVRTFPSAVDDATPARVVYDSEPTSMPRVGVHGKFQS